MSYQIKSIAFAKPILALAITNDDEEEDLFGVTCADKSVRAFGVGSGREIMSKRAHDQTLNCLCMSNNTPGRTPVMVTCSADNKVVMWNPVSSQIIRGLKIQVPEIRSIAVYMTPNDKTGAIGATYMILGSVNGLISVWDMNISKCHCILKDHRACVQALAVSKITHTNDDGSEVDQIVIVSGSSDRTARSWDLERGVAKVVFKTRHVVGTVAIAGNGFRPLIATAGADKAIRIWDESSGVLLHLMQGHLDAIFSINFWFHHEILLVSGGADNSVRVWDVLTGENVCTLLGHKDMVTGVVVATNPRPTIISSSIDCTIKVWDLDYIITLYYRSNFLCFSYAVGKRNDLLPDNPQYHYEKKSKAELLKASASGPGEDGKSTDGDHLAPVSPQETREKDVKIEKTGGSGEGTFEDDFDDNVAPLERNPAPLIRRNSSFKERIFGPNRRNSGKIRAENLMGDFAAHTADKDAEMQNKKSKAKKLLNQKLARKKGIEQDPDEESEEEDEDEGEYQSQMQSVKHAANHAAGKHQYSMGLKRGQSAAALRKRLDKVQAMKKERIDGGANSGDEADSALGGQADSESRDPAVVSSTNDDYDSMMSAYKGVFD